MRQRGRKSALKTSEVLVDVGSRRLEPPEHLDDRERGLFLEITAACSPKHFVASDLPLLAAFVQSILLSRAAVKKAGEDPRALATWDRATKMVATLATRLRLSPQSRTDPKTTARQLPNPLRNPWEDWGEKANAAKEPC